MHFSFFHLHMMIWSCRPCFSSAWSGSEQSGLSWSGSLLHNVLIFKFCEMCLWIVRPLKVIPLCCLVMSGTTYAVKQCHIPEVLIRHPHHCENLKTDTVLELYNTDGQRDMAKLVDTLLHLLLVSAPKIKISFIFILLWFETSEIAFKFLLLFVPDTMLDL